MTYTVFSDPHLGVDRKSHTTKSSRERLSEAVYEAALRASSKDVMQSHSGAKPICAGDLFDKYSNPEDVIMQGACIANSCHAILAGNHDLSGREDRNGSLQLLSQLKGYDIAIAKLGEVSVLYDSDLPVAYIPHHSTQALFEEAIDTFLNTGTKVEALFLHCNYNNEMAEGSDTSLNITPQQVDKLLTLTQWIFMGHEHNPRRLHNDRLIITGNTHPTSFSDISDKYVWGIDDQGRLLQHLVWSMDKHYRKIRWEAGMPVPDLTDVQFVDVVGEADKADRVALSKFVVEIWKSSDSLFMVRNSVELLSQGAEQSKRVDFSDLPSEISKQVQGRDIEQLWEKYSNAEINNN